MFTPSCATVPEPVVLPSITTDAQWATRTMAFASPGDASATVYPAGTNGAAFASGTGTKPAYSVQLEKSTSTEPSPSPPVSALVLLVTASGSDGASKQPPIASMVNASEMICFGRMDN